MDLLSLLDINNTLVNIPIGGGYAMSWVEGFGTILNNVVLYQQDVKEGVNQYVNDNEAMMNGERLAAITALETLCKQGA